VNSQGFSEASRFTVPTYRGTYRHKVCARSSDYARANTGAPETRATCYRDVIADGMGMYAIAVQ